MTFSNLSPMARRQSSPTAGPSTNLPDVSFPPHRFSLTFAIIVNAPLLALYAVWFCGLMATIPEMEETKSICLLSGLLAVRFPRSTRSDVDAARGSRDTGSSSHDRTRARAR